MCEFVSWIEKNGKVYFLTYDLIHNTPRGKMIQKQFPGIGELVGHAAIRAYWGLNDGEDKECTDFSSPDKFTPKIVSAIKEGQFKSFPMPQKLLGKPIDEKYEADLKLIDEKYWADRKPIDEKYEADLKPIDEKYEADLKLIYEKYWADRKPIYEKYWALFTISENRNPTWR